MGAPSQLVFENNRMKICNEDNINVIIPKKSGVQE
jgi:hypothetical protein